MGFLKNLSVIAKEVVNDKDFTQFMDTIDGTEEIAEKELNNLNIIFADSDINNEYFQNKADYYISQYAATERQLMHAYYLKAWRWNNESIRLLSLVDGTDKPANDDYIEGACFAEAQVPKVVDTAIGAVDDEDVLSYYLCEMWTLKAYCLDDAVERTRLLIRALPFAVDNDEREKVKKYISEKTVPYGISEQNTFMSRPYHDRQLIFIVRDLNHIGGCYDDSDNIKYVFPLDELPGDITFPLGHPQPNTLYYAHPLRPYYMPFENANILLFHEKIQEICRLFQCLGAEEITTTSIKGERISQSVVSSVGVDSEVGRKFLGTSGGFNEKVSGSENISRRNEMSLTQTFDPKRAPYCPDDLLWTKDDPEIQTFIKQRLEGGLLNFSRRVSSLETCNVSSSQLMDIKGAFSTMMSNVSANYSSEQDTTFDSVNESEWEISVRFRPIEDFGAELIESGIAETVVLSGLTPEEQKYKEEVEFCLEDDSVIDEQEQNSLERKRIKWGISEQRAKEIIQMCIPQFSETEQKYKEEILFCLEEDGVITEQDRKYLERKRVKLGISEKRANEIEAMLCNKTLSEDEQDYLDYYKELCEDGEISDRARRLLDRERDSLGISPSRASELEKM